MKIILGKYTNTHGIKGEIKILSNFDYKSKVFQKGFKLYINNQEYIIDNYRPHQEYDMVKFVGINNINDIESLKGSLVYIERNDLNLKEEEYLLSDLVDMNIIYQNKIIGKVQEIVYNKANILLNVIGKKRVYIPKQEHFIKNIDLKNNNIIVDNIEGLI